MSNELVEDVKVKGEISVLVGKAGEEYFITPRYYFLYYPQYSKERKLPLFKAKYQQRFQEQERAFNRAIDYELFTPDEIFMRAINTLIYLINSNLMPQRYLPQKREIEENYINIRSNNPVRNRHLNSLGEIKLFEYSFVPNFPSVLKGFLNWEKFFEQVDNTDFHRLVALWAFLSELSTQEGISFEQSVNQLIQKTLQTCGFIKK